MPNLKLKKASFIGGSRIVSVRLLTKIGIWGNCWDSECGPDSVKYSQDADATWKNTLMMCCVYIRRGYFCNELDIMKLFRGTEFEDASEELCGCQILVVDPAGNPVHFDSFLSLVVFTILESLRVSWQFCHPHCILIRLRKVFLSQGSISKHDECFYFCCCISTKPKFVAETKNSLGVLICIIIENSKLHWCWYRWANQFRG